MAMTGEQDEPIEAVLVDLIADLVRVAVARDVDAQEMLDRAERYASGD